MPGFIINPFSSDKNISSKLESFGRFAKAELIGISRPQQTVHELHEVKFGERLKRFFTEGRQARHSQRQAARAYRADLGNTHPASAAQLEKNRQSSMAFVRQGGAESQARTGINL